MTKTIFRWVLALLMISVGVSHFTDPDLFVRIMPAYIPWHWHLNLVYISGFFEILGGVGLLIHRTQAAAAWGLIALYVAVFPANINMAVNKIPFGGTQQPDWLLWARLPLQGVLIAWAWWMTRPNKN